MRELLTAQAEFPALPPVAAARTIVSDCKIHVGGRFSSSHFTSVFTKWRGTLDSRSYEWIYGVSVLQLLLHTAAENDY